MLHELLFALVGKPGNIIKLSETGLQLDAACTLFSQSQRQLINSMCVAGTHFRVIQAFIEDAVSSWSLPARSLTGNTQELDEADSSRSAYRKSLCYGLNMVMDQYKSLILAVQQQYLDNRFFTYANIQAELHLYLVLLPQLTSLITKIMQDDIRGGLLLQLLYSRLNSSNMWVRSAYESLFHECYKVLFNQLGCWILYGKLLDSYHQFFVHKIQSQGCKDIERDWDSMFTLQESMRPPSIVSKQTAQKILFIGKSVRILRYINKQQSLLPPQRLVESIKELETYESFKFDSVIERVRYEIAQQMMQLIMKKENLLGELQTLKSYYLMSKGQFFHIFLEQARPILSQPHDKKSQQYLNTLHLQNTIIRMNQEPNNRLSFELKQNGFNYRNFNNLANLNVIGSVSLKPNNFLRFQPVRSFGGSLWYNMKQNIDNNFSIKFSFRFKKLQPNNASLNATQLTADRVSRVEQEYGSTTICYVFQNTNEISSWRKDAPISLNDLKEYLCVKITMIESAKRTESKSLLSVCYYDQRKLKSQECLKEVMLDRRTNFAQEDFHQLKINYTDGNSYQGGILQVMIDDSDSPDSRLSITLKMSNLLNLDMGRAYMGFLQHSSHSTYAVDMISWEMAGNNNYNSSDYWSNLTIHYEIRQPLKLILSNQLMEKYKQIFKLLFPIRQAQIDLDRLWLKLQRRLKKCLKNRERQQVRKVSMLRNQLSMVINSLWSFLQSDVVETQWCKLVENLNKTDDFQRLRMYLDLYIKSISTMCFLTTPRILKSVFEIVKYCKDYVILCSRLEKDDSIESHTQSFYELESNYKEAFRMFTGQLKTASKSNTSNHIFQLLLRLDYNGFYEKALTGTYD